RIRWAGACVVISEPCCVFTKIPRRPWLIICSGILDRQPQLNIRRHFIGIYAVDARMFKTCSRRSRGCNKFPASGPATLLYPVRRGCNTASPAGFQPGTLGEEEMKRLYPGLALLVLLAFP